MISPESIPDQDLIRKCRVFAETHESEYPQTSAILAEMASRFERDLSVGTLSLFFVERPYGDYDDERLYLALVAATDEEDALAIDANEPTALFPDPWIGTRREVRRIGTADPSLPRGVVEAWRAPR